MGGNHPIQDFALVVLLFGVCFSVPPAGAMYEWIPPGAVCDSVHDYTPEPYDGAPPPLPKLPDQYTMNIQANILQKAWSSDVTEHYDGPNNKAAVFLTFNGTTTQTIFNYKTMETYDIYPDGSCKARGGRADYFGFFKMDRNHRPIKSTVYEMFHMGPKQNFTYVGNTWVRGIRVNHWTSCQEWTDWGAKFQLDYYFSHEDYQTAWGMGQIPIRAVVNGTAGNQDENQKSMMGRHKFEHIYDFTAFKVGPIKDQTVFQLPHDVVCTGRRDYKALPVLPDNFQMDMEMNCPVMGSSAPFQHSVRYDWEHRMVETYMHIPSPQMDVTMDSNSNPVPRATDKMVVREMSTIDDHSTGLRYVTEKMNNTCRVSPMPEGKDAMPMDHGESLFAIHSGQKTGASPFTYQGRSTFRNIPVDVWGVESDGILQKVFFLADDKEPMIMNNDGDDDKNSGASNPWASNSNGDGKRPDGSGGRPKREVEGGPSGGKQGGSGGGGGGGGGSNPKGRGSNSTRPTGMPARGKQMMEEAKERARQSTKPTGMPKGRGQQMMEEAKERAKQSAAGPTAGPGGRAKQMMEEAKEKARQKVTEKTGSTNMPNSWKNMMQSAKDKMNQTGGGNMGQISQEMIDNYKKFREQKRKEDGGNAGSGGTSGAGGISGAGGMAMPHESRFPILVGMVFRNHTAISTRNMPSFFQQVMQPEMLEYSKQMSEKFKANMASQQSEGSMVLDTHAMMNQMHARMMRHVGEMDMNVFHFQPLHTDESMFQVSQCYEPEQTSRVLLHVDAPFKRDVLANKAAFAISMRKGIAEAMGVSYVQVSDLKPEPHVDAEKNIDATFVSFSLLGSPPVKAPRTKPPSISEAKRKLVQAIRNGISFKVNYPTHTKSFLVDKSNYSVDRRIFQTPSSQAAAEASSGNSQSGHSDSDSSDYSPASVGGIAIATLMLGFIMAVAMVVVLKKRKHPEEPVIPYKISKA